MRSPKIPGMSPAKGLREPKMPAAVVIKAPKAKTIKVIKVAVTKSPKAKFPKPGK